MDPVTRRTFLQTTAAAATTLALPSLGKGWYALAGGEDAAYFEKEFGITDALCRKVLAQALGRGGDFAELYFEHTVSNWLGLEDGQVNRAFGQVDLGVGIRTVAGDQVGYGFTQLLDEPSMLAAAGTAATIASGSATTPAGALAWGKTGNYYPLDRLIADVPLQPRVQLVQSLNERCFALSKQLVKVTAQLHAQQKRILIVTSEGVKVEDLQPRVYLTAMAVAEKDGKRERAGWNLGGRRSLSFYTPEIVNEIAKGVVQRVLIMFEAIPAPAGEVPVVLGPGVTGILLHEAIGHGMEADFNRKGMSTYATMLGRKVAEPFVTILDDGTVPELLGAINVDDEGTPGQRTVLVDKGILTSYMHDRISARFYKVAPTGNGRRQSYQHYIQPRMRNTYMLAGPATPEELIRAAGNGILVEDVSNGEVKIGEGDFAFFVSQDRMIKDGKLGAPIKDINIMGNGPKMLANVIGVANDFQFARQGTGGCGKGGQAVPVGFGQPSILVKSLTVGGVKA